MSDELDREMLHAVAAYLKRSAASESDDQQAVKRTPLGDVVSERLCANASQIAAVAELIATQ